MRLKEVAKEAGLSISMVSKALSGKKEISIDTKRKVQKIAQKLGYSPNILARSLVKKYSMTIGLITPYVGHPTAVERIRGMERAASERGYLVVSCTNDGFPEEENKQIDILLGRMVDGIVIQPTGDRPILIKKLESSGKPFVLMSDFIRGVETDFVGDDDREGGRLAARHLIETGYNKIGYLGSNEDSSSDREILQGIKEVLSKKGIIIDNGQITWGNMSRDRVRENVPRLAEKGVEAIIAVSDLTAIWTIKELERIGISVPEEMAVIGYDGIELSGFFDIPLTTLEQPNFLIGYKAGELLIKRIKEEKKGSRGPKERIIYSPRLVIRRSCGCNGLGGSFTR